MDAPVGDRPRGGEARCVRGRRQHGGRLDWSLCDVHVFGMRVSRVFGQNRHTNTVTHRGEGGRTALRQSAAGQSRGSVGRVSWTSQSHASPGLHFGAGGKATEVPGRQGEEAGDGWGWLRGAGREGGGVGAGASPPWLVKVRPCLPRQSSVPSLCLHRTAGGRGRGGAGGSE